jgi:hypothetical protein
MSRENVETARAGVDAWGRRDIEERVAAVAHLAMRGRQSRLEIKSTVGVVVDFRDDKIDAPETYAPLSRAPDLRGLGRRHVVVDRDLRRRP